MQNERKINEDDIISNGRDVVAASDVTSAAPETIPKICHTEIIKELVDAMEAEDSQSHKSVNTENIKCIEEKSSAGNKADLILEDYQEICNKGSSEVDDIETKSQHSAVENGDINQKLASPSVLQQSLHEKVADKSNAVCEPISKIDSMEMTAKSVGGVQAEDFQSSERVDARTNNMTKEESQTSLNSSSIGEGQRQACSEDKREKSNLVCSGANTGAPPTWLQEEKNEKDTNIATSMEAPTSKSNQIHSKKQQTKIHHLKVEQISKNLDINITDSSSLNVAGSLPIETIIKSSNKSKEIKSEVSKKRVHKNFCTPPRERSPRFRCHSPATVSDVCHNKKLAVKVDLAISAAAIKFEEQLARNSSCPDLTSNYWSQRPRFNSSSQVEAVPFGEIFENITQSHSAPTTVQKTETSTHELTLWLTSEIFKNKTLPITCVQDETCSHVRDLLEDTSRFNIFCRYLADKINEGTGNSTTIEPFELSEHVGAASPFSLAADFVRYIFSIAAFAGATSPFGEENPFLLSTEEKELSLCQRPLLVQQIIFDHDSGKPERLVRFARQVFLNMSRKLHKSLSDKTDNHSSSNCSDKIILDRRSIFPEGHPSPFETAIQRNPKIISHVLRFIGDPVAVCRLKMVDRLCYKFIDNNEHQIIRDAVRLGGLSMNVRPSFWLWVSLQKSEYPSKAKQKKDRSQSSSEVAETSSHELPALEQIGREGKWQHVIERDVSRAFGNLPPHKNRARLRADSIFRALITWGRSRTMKCGVKGSGEAPPPSRTNSNDEDDEAKPTDTVSDWGGVTPVASFQSSASDEAEAGSDKADGQAAVRHKTRMRADELALSGNALTEEMKSELQGKLRYVLHALAAAHPDIGYCQGMDYVVAHLLRLLQETVRWKAANGTLPGVVESSPDVRFTEMNPQAVSDIYAQVDQTLVVEETCFRVMDSFFSEYGLGHF